MKVVSLWLAVDDSTPENGCMRVIPGTHHMDLQQLQERTDVKSVLDSSMDESKVDESKARDVILRKGDVSVHHPQLVHGSLPNNSEKRRAGLTIRYIPSSTKIKLDETKLASTAKGGVFPSAFHLRGKIYEGVNEYNPFPKYKEGVHMPFKGCETWLQ
jgi:phytanoyl-CoA hydroxylase